MKKWEERDQKWVLIFDPYETDSENEIAELYLDEDDDWCVTSTMLGMADDFLCESWISLEEAKKDVEERILEHFNEQLAYCSEQIRAFKE